MNQLLQWCLQCHCKPLELSQLPESYRWPFQYVYGDTNVEHCHSCLCFHLYPTKVSNLLGLLQPNWRFFSRASSHGAAESFAIHSRLFPPMVHREMRKYQLCRLGPSHEKNPHKIIKSAVTIQTIIFFDCPFLSHVENASLGCGSILYPLRSLWTNVRNEIVECRMSLWSLFIWSSPRTALHIASLRLSTSNSCATWWMASQMTKNQSWTQAMTG